MDPQVQSLLILVIIGALAGWFAGLIVRGFGFGLVGNIIVGIIGAFLGSWLLATLNVVFLPGSPLINTILTATLGAVVLLLIIRVLKRA